MKLIAACALILPLSLTACNANLNEILQSSADVASATGYTNQASLINGIKQTLELSTTRATGLLGTEGGYSKSNLYRIALPENLQKISSTLRQFGLGSQVDKVELLMNQGAEKAAVEAKDVFITAVKNMSVTDALGIVRGGNTGATDYFKAQTEATLRSRYSPIIKSNLEQIGFYNQYQQLLTTYNALPIANKPSLDLEKHVIDQSLSALFDQVGVQEKLIRQDPVGRGSALIGTVLGAK
jgi:hypothetical protein